MLMMLCSYFSVFFFFKQKTAYEMRISDWSSDVCSSDLRQTMLVDEAPHFEMVIGELRGDTGILEHRRLVAGRLEDAAEQAGGDDEIGLGAVEQIGQRLHRQRSEEHTSELQSLMRISYAVCCLKKKKKGQRVSNTDY